jgi:heat shock protein HslJ
MTAVACVAAIGCVVGVSASAAAQGGSGLPAPDLQGSAWQLVRFQGGDDTTREPDDRSKYTLEFGPDGRVAVRFDCNRGAGSWKATGASRIEFGPMAMTRAMCPPGSMHDQLVKHWAFIRSYVVRDGHLYLSLMADGGIYEFEPGTATGLRRISYMCGTSEITTALRDATLDLSIGGKSFSLTLTTSASGARYESTGTPAVTFWNKGTVATLTIGATTYPECVRQP